MDKRARVWAVLASAAGLALVALALITLPSCGGSEECGDGADNDGDGFIDSADPGCEVNGDAESPDPEFTACNDGVDNDGDGNIDADDPGCEDSLDRDEYNVPLAGCRDGIDNDGDGLIDFPNDPGCLVSLDDDEDDDCPNGSTCPACSNGADDDEDEQADYPDDLGCDSAADQNEFNADPSICGAAVSLQPLPNDGVANGFIDGDGTNELISLDCGGAGSESVYQMVVDQPVALVASTDFAETEVDTVLYLRSECREFDTEIECNDDSGEDTGSSISIERVEPGTYYLVVDGHTSGLSGAYRLEVDQYVALGEDCDPGNPSIECAPGLVCRLFNAAATDETCQMPECSDGQDNVDGDGLTDYPNDPGCDSADDNDEADLCPSDASCPECGNGVDDADPEDSDADFPADSGCNAASDTTETDCIDSDPVVVITQPLTTGNTSTATHDFELACSSSFSMNAPDIVHSLVVPGTLASLELDTDDSGFDTVLAIRANECTAADIECDDEGGVSFGDSAISLTSVAPGTYYIIVDAWSTSSGAYNLNVSGVIQTGQPCNPAQISSGLFTCQGGGACSTTCQAP